MAYMKDSTGRRLDSFAAVSRDEASLGTMVTDAFFTYNWTQPNFQWNAARKRVYGGITTAGGQAEAVIFDRRSGRVERIPVGTTLPDDHNAAAVYVPPDEDKASVTALSGHAVDNSLRIRMSKVPGALNNLSDETVIDTTAGGPASYARIWHRYGTQSIAVMARCGGSWWFARATSATYDRDGTTSWQTLVRFHGKPYMVHRRVGNTNTMHVVVGQHPTESSDNMQGAWYMQVNLDTGAITRADGGTIDPSFWTLATVIPTANLSVASPVVTYPTTFRLFDVGPGGSVLIGRFNIGAGSMTYTVRRRSGSTWTDETLVSSGAPFGYTQSMYVGGCIFGATEDEIYLCRESAGVWTLERWTRSAGTWSIAQTLLTRSDGRKLARPVVPEGGWDDPDCPLVVAEIHSYASDSYDEFLADVVLVDRPSP